ncbi:MAG: tryptophan--tRNA ligase [Chloroflexi bacterium]|nr:tryptophan--tRNA ligase [Chloroflexota bacterium]
MPWSDKRVLSGDRPSGKLHLGHLVGTLRNRVRLQDQYKWFFVVADLHALTTEYQHTEDLKRNVREVVLDYLSVGIDPDKSTIYVQSLIPEVAEIFVLFSMLATVNRLQRIPTLKDVMRDRHITKPSLGLLSYPVLQAADIVMVRADFVPVGEDQAPHLEVTRELIRRFNRLYGASLPVPDMIPGDVPSLPGTDGQAKMSKSLGNAIYLSDDAETVTHKVFRMYTDSARVHATTPGHVDGNPVFMYHDVFNPDKAEVETMKNAYLAGQIPDVEVKKRLALVLNQVLGPIRESRKRFAAHPGIVDRVLSDGTKAARVEARQTLAMIKEATRLPSLADQ